MTVHVDIVAAAGALAGGQVFPLVADEGTLPPYAVFQVVGGDPMSCLSGERPEKRQRRVQFSVWAKTTLEAQAIAEQIEVALSSAAHLQTEVLTIAIDTYDEVKKLRGAMQDFMLFC
jgi:hypothetical protein